MSCPYDDCIAPSRGCEEMHKLKEAQRTGKKYAPPESWGARDITDPQALLNKGFSKMEKRPAKPKPKPPAIELEELPQQPIQHTVLHHYNETIRALEVLHDSATKIGPAIPEMIVTIKNDRAARFDYLIDWDAVARGGCK